MAPQPLPAEIRDRIVDHLHGDGPTLRSCALAGRALADTARWHLSHLATAVKRESDLQDAERALNSATYHCRVEAPKLLAYNAIRDRLLRKIENATRKYGRPPTSKHLVSAINGATALAHDSAFALHLATGPAHQLLAECADRAAGLVVYAQGLGAANHHDEASCSCPIATLNSRAVSLREKARRVAASLDVATESPVDDAVVIARALAVIEDEIDQDAPGSLYEFAMLWRRRSW